MYFTTIKKKKTHNTKKLTILTGIQPFFLHKCFLNCCKPLVNFQSLEKLTLTILASFLIAFIEERNFGDPYFVVFANTHGFALCISPWPPASTTWGKVKAIITPGQDFPGGAVVKNPPANARDMGLSPGPGRSHMLQSN